MTHVGLHSTKKPVSTMLTYPWKCTVLHCNHLRNTWKPLVLMTQHFDYCPSAREGDNQSVRSSTPVVSRCFPGGYNVKLYISRGRLAWCLLAFLHSAGYHFASIIIVNFLIITENLDTCVLIFWGVTSFSTLLILWYICISHIITFSNFSCTVT